MSDEGTRRTSRDAHSAAHGYLHGLRASVRNNASAYGFSVTITASMALLSSIQGTPKALQIVAFAGGAVAAFAVVEMVVTWGFTRGLEDEPTDVKELGSSISILSVGVALGCAYATGRLVGGFVAWPLGSFVGTVAYLFLFGVELGLANRIQRRRANNRRAAKSRRAIHHERRQNSFHYRHDAPDRGVRCNLRRIYLPGN